MKHLYKIKWYDDLKTFEAKIRLFSNNEQEALIESKEILIEHGALESEMQNYSIKKVI